MKKLLTILSFIVLSIAGKSQTGTNIVVVDGNPDITLLKDYSYIPTSTTDTVKAMFLCSFLEGTSTNLFLVRGFLIRRKYIYGGIPYDNYVFSDAWVHEKKLDGSRRSLRTDYHVWITHIKN